MKMQRREWLWTAGVAALAAGGGAGFAWWRRQADAAAMQVEATLWAASFDKPEGGRLAVADLRGRPLVVNFWAPWCAPCVREMPALDRFARDHAARGWQVLGIAADEAAAVRSFLARSPVSFPIGLAGFAGLELSRQLGNAAGGLPFTLLLGADGRVRQRHTGETSYDELSRLAAAIG